MLACTLTVECKTVLDNADKLSKDKVDIIPEDAVFVNELEVQFKAGDSAFDVLQSYAKENKLHIDSEKSIYGEYIKAIGNLYLGDCGEQSAWMFKVNGKGSEVSSSQYKLNNGDKIEFLYSCDYGIDVGIG